MCINYNKFILKFSLSLLFCFQFSHKTTFGPTIPSHSPPPSHRQWLSFRSSSHLSSLVGLLSSLSLFLSWALSWVCFSAGILKPRVNGRLAAAAQPAFSLPLVSAILLQGKILWFKIVASPSCHSLFWNGRLPSELYH